VSSIKDHYASFTKQTFASLNNQEIQLGTVDLLGARTRSSQSTSLSEKPQNALSKAPEI